MKREQYYDSKGISLQFWKNVVRRKMIITEQSKCLICERIHKRMVVHHTDYNNQTFSSFVVLCSPCHKFVHSTGLELSISASRAIKQGLRNYEIAKLLKIPISRIWRLRKRILLSNSSAGGKMLE